MTRLVAVFFLFFPLWLSAQRKGTVHGKVVSDDGRPLSGVNITAGKNAGTATDSLGHFRLALSPGTYRLVFSHLGYATRIIKINLKAGENKVLNISLSAKSVEINPVTVRAVSRREKEGAVVLTRKIIDVTPVLNNNIKGFLMIIPSVSQTDELSSQYTVRGGNFDENAVFINGIEVFRPYLTRTGKQEGLSIVNPALVDGLAFYAGGFPARLGDKLSSVLDIRYMVPEERLTKINLSFTGGDVNMFFPGRYVDAIASVRYLNNYWLVRNTVGDAEYRPAFGDWQSYIRFHKGKHWRHGLLTYFSLNRYRFVPYTKISNFGTFTDSRSLVIRYDGQEKDAFDSQFAALKSVYSRPGYQWKFINSFYHTFEREYFDLLASYFIGEPNSDLGDNDFGNPMNLRSLGQQLDHARNLLDALIAKSDISYKRRFADKSVLESGISFSYENIRDRTKEYQVIDSAGFSVLPPGSSYHPDEPYESDTFPVLPFRYARSDYRAAIDRAMYFLSYTRKFQSGNWKGEISAGFRMGFWHFNEYENQFSGSGFVFSPRLLFYIRNSLFPKHRMRMTAGLFMQPPSYKEFKNAAGEINPSVKAQKAWNFSLADAFSFEKWGFPFTLHSEVYYRFLYDVNPYTIENIRIRYQAGNNAVAYAYGAEMRLNAGLLPGNESRLSLAYMRTEQNIDHRGYIPRPSDQRFKMALLFRDYVPSMPFLKMYLNNVFFTGLPTGAPLYADPYKFRFRTRNYWRTDVGLYYVLTDRRRKSNFISRFRDFSIGIEIINMFNRRNSLSNLWVREIYTKRMFGVPNYMTGRIFNLKLKMEF